jgi:hypothetical protein
LVNTYHSALLFDWWDRGQDFTKDMWGARKPLWEIWALIQNLQPGSALNRKVDPEQWRLEHHMIADLFDLTAMGSGVVDAKKAPAKYERPADRELRRVREDRIAQRLRDDQGRFAKQLAAGGDV